MDHPLTPSRRRFLRTLAASATAPYVTSGLRAAPANGKLNHASIGAAGQAWGDVSVFLNHPKFQLVAIADVDSTNLAKVKAKHPDVRVYQDWRELFEKESDKIDSVNVSTPDHMHGPIGMAALGRGKHLYGQKPLTQNLHECRVITEKARSTGLMTQMGIQVSSDFPERIAVDIAQSGVIGKIKEVHTWSGKDWGDPEPRPEHADPIPEGLNWDWWLGVAADRPFLKGYYHPGNWRKRRDFGTGTLGDMGCHIFSSWFRGLKLTSPISVKSTGPKPNEHNWALNGRVEYTFPGTEVTEGKEVKVFWYDGTSRPPEHVMKLVDGKDPGQASLFIGTEGVMLFPHSDTPTLYPREKFKDFRPRKLEPRQHYNEFVDCCLAGKDKPSANFDYAGPLTEAVLLGCLASLFPNENLLWDAAKMSFSNSEAATAFVKRGYRKGWEVAGF